MMQIAGPLNGDGISDAVVIAIVTMLGGTLTVAIGGYFSLKNKLAEQHVRMNSRLDEMMVLVKNAANAEGNRQGRVELAAETAAVIAAHQPLPTGPIDIKLSGPVSVKLDVPLPEHIDVPQHREP